MSDETLGELARVHAGRRGLGVPWLVSPHSGRSPRTCFWAVCVSYYLSPAWCLPTQHGQAGEPAPAHKCQVTKPFEQFVSTRREVRVSRGRLDAEPNESREREADSRGGRGADAAREGRGLGAGVREVRRRARAASAPKKTRDRHCGLRMHVSAFTDHCIHCLFILIVCNIPPRTAGDDVMPDRCSVEGRGSGRAPAAARQKNACAHVSLYSLFVHVHGNTLRASR